MCAYVYCVLSPWCGWRPPVPASCGCSWTVSCPTAAGWSPGSWLQRWSHRSGPRGHMGLGLERWSGSVSSDNTMFPPYWEINIVSCSNQYFLDRQGINRKIMNFLSLFEIRVQDEYAFYDMNCSMVFICDTFGPGFAHLLVPVLFWRFLRLCIFVPVTAPVSYISKCNHNYS